MFPGAGTTDGMASRGISRPIICRRHEFIPKHDDLYWNGRFCAKKMMILQFKKGEHISSPTAPRVSEPLRIESQHTCHCSGENSTDFRGNSPLSLPTICSICEWRLILLRATLNLGHNRPSTQCHLLLYLVGRPRARRRPHSVLTSSSCLWLRMPLRMTCSSCKRRAMLCGYLPAGAFYIVFPLFFYCFSTVFLLVSGDSLADSDLFWLILIYFGWFWSILTHRWHQVYRKPLIFYGFVQWYNLLISAMIQTLWFYNGLYTINYDELCIYIRDKVYHATATVGFASQCCELQHKCQLCFECPIRNAEIMENCPWKMMILHWNMADLFLQFEIRQWTLDRERGGVCST